MSTPVPLHYRTFGHGPALVILHGLLGSGTNWRTLARRLGEHFLVIVPDARNHGLSPHTDDMSYATQANDILPSFGYATDKSMPCLGSQHGRKNGCGVRRTRSRAP